MFTDFVLWLSDVFKVSFEILPMIGYVAGWFFTIAGIVWFVYWCMQIASWGNK
ncbi:MAG: hypothetical protein H6604_04345 [Flavobacteriales bacterium]|nr:hypothetical protein [Flavobacteriales bacterium]